MNACQHDFLPGHNSLAHFLLTGDTPFPSPLHCGRANVHMPVHNQLWQSEILFAFNAVYYILSDVQYMGVEGLGLVTIYLISSCGMQFYAPMGACASYSVVNWLAPDFALQLIRCCIVIRPSGSVEISVNGLAT